MKNCIACLACLLICITLNAADGGSVKGSVKYDGAAPAPKTHPLPADKQADCKCQQVELEDLVVDKASNGIRWAIIRIMDVKGPELAQLPADVSIEQIGCRFLPHALIAAPGASLHMLNPDKVAHNVRTIGYDLMNPPTNQMMSASEEKKTLKGSKYFVEPEIVQIVCDLHPWMKCFVIVHDPRYAAISNADGTFEIKDVPPGKYKLKVFQEKMGEKELDVEIQSGKHVDLGDIKFKEK